ncbi:hypothetical protein B0H63DRAFT_528041 [Podospora didyma]|uniref:Uncharacterized protein n=1 Tax=Podospora didyma TaxID=330526 RepID=A0AAE0N4B8_9PEZI|nr:hypothetical protein B0H63DRAFT_528041 [Podospora didyma]
MTQELQDTETNLSSPSTLSSASPSQPSRHEEEQTHPISSEQPQQQRRPLPSSRPSQPDTPVTSPSGTPPPPPSLVTPLPSHHQPLHSSQQYHQHLQHSPSPPLVIATTHLITTSEVMQALDMARDDEEAECNAKINAILNTALGQIWAKVEAHPDSYMMTRDEFAVFNFFQSRFVGNPVAIAARRRFWDNFRP